ncbi:Ndj1p Ecym_3596 [Eremothecium cymbalariae DBVPG|uniref:Uncharacterized protein n=1 Tax=Eremothecium cymbalariae (strain CBS 270.75 / DBVPG 7215 / KCTC 17166 / NRRL Y-17582) TaxID=931890 RepID=G8JQS7_ERECY|nr:Hypothetical protein Ecym_3596 [Eremothecium cymbalariae DBVPG\
MSGNRIGEEVDKTVVPSSRDCSVLGKTCQIPLVTISRPAEEWRLPPKEFVSTITTKISRECSNYTLLSWLLNDPMEVSLTTTFDTCPDPFRLFKKGNKAAYKSFFSFQSEEVVDSNTTLSSELVKVSVFPRILQYTRLDEFKMDHLCDQYIKQFVKVLYKYNQGKEIKDNRSGYLQANLTKLVQSYARDVFHDIVHKWFRWTELMKTGSTTTQRSEYYKKQIAQVIEKLMTKYWEQHMVIGHNLFEEFVEKMDTTTDRVSTSITDTEQFRIVYGIWIDTQNGILLLCNGLISTWETCLSPTMGVTLDTNYLETIRKLIFFLNCSILECYNWHLRADGSHSLV